MKPLAITAAAALAAFASLAGAEETPTAEAAPTSAPETVAEVAPAAEPAPSAQPVTEFRIGLLGGENTADRLRSNECLREKVEELLGVPTSLFPAANYEGVVQGLLGANLDMAWLGASSYAKVYLEDPEAVQPVLVKINTDGTFGYHSIGFARRDSGVTSLDDMKGKVFAFGDPNSTSGFLIPSIEIPQAGYTMEKGSYFKDVVFTGGHEQTIVAVFNKSGPDAGVTWADGLGEWEDGFNSGAFRKAVDSGLVDMTELREIWRSKVIPEGPIVLRRALPEDVKLKLVGMMAAMPSMDPDCAYGVMAGEVKGIAPITHEAYLSVIEARRALAEQ